MDRYKIEELGNNILIARIQEELKQEREQLRKDREIMNNINTVSAWVLGVFLGVFIGYLLPKVI